MTTTDINVHDLLKTLHYCERYPEGYPSLQAIRVEVDNALYALYREQLRLGQKISFAVEDVHRAAGDKSRWAYEGRRSYSRWSMDLDTALKTAAGIAGDPSVAGYISNQAKEALQRLVDARAAYQANKDAQQPLREAYSARPWTRAFLVTDGHVHSSMDCSTCFPTTEFSWLTQFSDHSEDEIVEAAGERACTVCYPSAPTLRSFEKASALFTEEEAERNAAREQRKAEKAERQAKKIAAGLTEDGSEFRATWIDPDAIRYINRERVVGPAEAHEDFKTERAAVIWAVSTLADIQTGYAFKSCQVPGVEQVIEAVARKHGKTTQEVRAEINNKVAAKIKRDGRG